MRKIFRICLVVSLIALARCSLLEMSQTLWAKLLAGGLAKVGSLDPLKVPLIKIDQSEGNTSYRMILRNVELLGLNGSTLESVHVARGRLKSNFSELEAGYVSYSDLKELESIRYKFHTLVRELKSQNGSFEAVLSSTDRATDSAAESFASTPSPEESRSGRIMQYEPRLSRIQNERLTENQEQREIRREQQTNYQERPLYREVPRTADRREEQSYVRRKVAESSQPMRHPNYPSSVEVVYAHSAKNFAESMGDLRSDLDEPDCPGNCQSRRRTQLDGSAGRDSRKDSSREAFVESGRRTGGSVEDAQTSASERLEVKGYEQESRTGSREFMVEQTRRRGRVFNEKTKADSEEVEVSKSRNPRIEDQPGYIDIVYADDKPEGGMKHFGNLMMSSMESTKVYGFEDIMKDIRENKDFLLHNFTEGESLTKRNDVIKAALEGSRLKDLVRYAKNYQEQQGYFEQGMEIVYHYGGMEDADAAKSSASKDGKRIKRAHREDLIEDDVMHVILRIRVPLLRVKSQYLLMGKVGQEILRGNGILTGNFTELIGDFTVELKKINQTVLIVRAARAKLAAKDKKIDLQGMDEKGPVASILTQGLMAAEAVAAMLADDLATKALNEKTADAMVYKMYKDLPEN